MKKKLTYLSLFISIFALFSCGGDDEEEENNPKPTNVELSIDPYIKYVGLSLDEIQNYFTEPLEYNVINYYAHRQWLYNQVFNAIFYFDDNNICYNINLRRSDEDTTTFEHFKLFTKEAFTNLGEPLYAAVYKYAYTQDGGNEYKDIKFEVGTPHKKGAYEETINYAEKNNISKIGHVCEMIWERNNHKIKYIFSTQISEVYIHFTIIIT